MGRGDGRRSSERVTADEISARLPSESEILIVSHEGADGDALGCVVALALMAERLGIRYRMYLPGEATFPQEYDLLPRLDDILRGPFPAGGENTTVYVLDCASADRFDSVTLRCYGSCINIDHHQDNMGFGNLNLVDATAGATTQILYEIFKAGDLPMDSSIATALYVGLVTDTGRFQYSNTTPAVHRVAAELQELGVDVNDVSDKLYGRMPLPKALLMQKVLARLELSLDGRLAMSWLRKEDFEEAGADEGHVEGLIDVLRSIDGVMAAALVRERLAEGTEYKVSLRAADGTVNVATIAHERSGGGHVAAAGFRSSEDLENIMELIESGVRDQL